MEKKDIQTVEKNMDKATEMSKGMVPMEWQDAFLVCVFSKQKHVEQSCNGDRGN